MFWKKYQSNIICYLNLKRKNKAPVANVKWKQIRLISDTCENFSLKLRNRRRKYFLSVNSVHFAHFGQYHLEMQT